MRWADWYERAHKEGARGPLVRHRAETGRGYVVVCEFLSLDRNFVGGGGACLFETYVYHKLSGRTVGHHYPGVATASEAREQFDRVCSVWS